MKRAVTILLSAMLLLFTLSACNKGGQSFAASPEEEYRRVASLQGDGRVFDIDSMTSFEVVHKGSILSPSIVSDDGAGIANIEAVYQCDLTPGKIKTFADHRYIWMFSDDGSGTLTPAYGTTSPQGYQNGAYYWGAGMTPDTRSYEEILEVSATTGPETPETLYRKNLTLPPADCLEGFEGGKSGGVYTVKAVFQDTDTLQTWMKDFYYYLKLYTEDVGDFPFFDFAADYEHKAVLTIRSTKQSLTDVVLQLETMGKYGLGETVFEAHSVFKSGKVTVRDITEA